MLGDCANCNTNYMCYKKGKSCTPVDQGEILSLYDDEDRRIMEAAAYVEGTFYMQHTRLQETVDFAKKMGYQKLGIGFCIGVRDEAKDLAKYLTNQGFTVVSVCCKNCAINKDDLGLTRVRPQNPFETMCNPKGQGQHLNEQHVDLVISVGLCVGHDALFSRACKAPVTTFAVKDRVLGNNPMAALYSGYWRRKLGLSD